MRKDSKFKKGQSAIEYLILATTITIVVLVGFDERRGFLQQARNLTEGMFNESLRQIMGNVSTRAARSYIDSESGDWGYP